MKHKASFADDKENIKDCEIALAILGFIFSSSILCAIAVIIYNATK